MKTSDRRSDVAPRDVSGAAGVKKRMKDKTFAAGVSREDIADACARAALDVTELIEFVVRSQKEVGVI